MTDNYHRIACAIADIIGTYNASSEAKDVLHELVVAAFGSEHADMWDKDQRAGMLLFEELFRNLIDVIFVE